MGIGADKKILVSWISYGNDFLWPKKESTDDTIRINTSGPTFTFYQQFFNQLNYTSHKIFCLAKDVKLADRLAFEVERYFLKDGIVEVVLIPDTDAIDSSKLFPLVSSALSRLKGISPTKQRNQDKKKKDNVLIDVFFSTGTPAMQITWAFCKFDGLVDKLYQTRRKIHVDEQFEELVELSFPASNITRFAIYKESSNANSFLIDKIDSLKQIYEKAKIVANFDFTVLILGESGTGKENLAQTIHQSSRRAQKVFKSINCAALGESLLESRLFGYLKGAFSGANQDTDGYFDLANGGTIFLDEIGDITPYMQQTLLRVLQEGEFTAVGSTVVKKTDVRIIAATNRNLIELCKKGLFRWDLYYRLAVIELELPKFRDFSKAERRAFLHFFIKDIGEQLSALSVKPLKLSKEAESYLLEYDFPGNIRELKHIVEGFYAHQVDEIKISDFPKRLTGHHSSELPTNDQGLVWDWKYHEKKLIEKALQHFGTQAAAAAAIGYKNATYFGKKIKEYNIMKAKN